MHSRQHGGHTGYHKSFLKPVKGGVSEPGNKFIIKMFNLIRIGERAGSGVPDLRVAHFPDGSITVK